MLQRLLRRSVLGSGILRLGIKQRCSCALQSVGCPDTKQTANMIRNRAQIKRVLCVAEKNDAAKGISDIMSNGRFRRVIPASSYESNFRFYYFVLWDLMSPVPF